MYHNFSSGAKRDLFIILLVKGLLQVSLNDEETDGTLEHEANEKINEHMQSVIDQIDKTMNSIPKGLMATIQKWISKRLNYTMKPLLVKLSQHEVQLEILDCGITEDQNGDMYQLAIKTIQEIR